MNVSKFRNIQFEYTYYPPMDPSHSSTPCVTLKTGVPIAVNKPTWRVFDYTYDLHVMQERYNVVFESGNGVNER